MIVFLILAVILVPFAFVLLFGAPYLPTRKQYANEALDLLGLKKGETFVDLGSGDGTVLLEAARRGYICYGYELNPFLWVVSWLRTWRFRSHVHIYCRNFWQVELPKNTKGVFVFLLDKYMIKLDKKLTQELTPGSSLISYTFKIPKKRIYHEKNGLWLYHY